MIISLLVQGCNCCIIQAYIFYTKISKEKKTMNNDDSYFIASSMLRYEKPTAKEIFMEQAYVSIISSVSETSLLRWFSISRWRVSRWARRNSRETNESSCYLVECSLVSFLCHFKGLETWYATLIMTEIHEPHKINGPKHVYLQGILNEKS
jgi:hypothetical protein